MRFQKILFIVFAFIFAGAGIFHFIGIFYPVNEDSVTKHIIFVFINVFSVYANLRRPKIYLYLLPLLLLEQYYSHGSYMIRLWNESGEIHWISLLDLIIYPCVLLLHYNYWRRRKRESRLKTD